MSDLIQTGSLNTNQVYKMGFDAFMNIAARTGFGQPNLMNATEYPLTRLTQNYPLLNSLYRNNWLVRNGIKAIPAYALKNDWRYEADIDRSQLDKLKKMEHEIGLKHKLKKGLTMGRLYGGAVGLILLKGQGGMLHKPLDLDDIMPGDFRGLDIVDRWTGANVVPGLVSDMDSKDYGLPEFYEFTGKENNSAPLRVHHSRIVRFTGHDLPRWEEDVEQQWGASIVEDVYEELKKRDNTSANIANLIFQANLRVFKVADLGEVLAGGNEGNKKDLYAFMEALNRLHNNNSMAIIGKEDEFQNFAASFSGLNEIYESFMIDSSAAWNIPVSILFGQLRGGMNTNGETEMTQWYDTLKEFNEDHSIPALDKLTPILCMSTFGQVPDDIEVKFNPIYTPSEKESVELVKGRVESITTLYNTGAFSDRFLLEETKALSPYGFGNSITDEDVASASDKPTGLMMQKNPLEGDDKPTDE